MKNSSISPKEYIKCLQEQNDTQYYFDGELLTNSGILGTIEQASERENIDTDWGELLFDYIKPRLNSNILELFNIGKVAIGEVDIPEPNARLEIIETGYAIIFNSGMRDYIYRVVRSLCTSIVPENEKPEVSFMDMCQVIAEVFWWTQKTYGFAFGPDYKLSKYQMEIANILSKEAESFFICHEIGHILIDIGRKMGIEEYLQLSSYDEEFEADKIALLTLLFAPEAKQSNLSADVVYAGIELAIQVFRGLELVGVVFETTHPTAEQRLSSLRSCIRELLDDDTYAELTTLSSSINEVFENVVKLLNKPSLENEKYYENKARQVIEDLEELLDECTTGIVPDYIRFCTNASFILNKGFPEIVLEEIANIANAAFDERKFNEGKLDVKSLQQWKLLIRYFAEQKEPIRGAFLKHLGC